MIYCAVRSVFLNGGSSLNIWPCRRIQISESLSDELRTFCADHETAGSHSMRRKQMHLHYDFTLERTVTAQDLIPSPYILNW